MTQRPFRRSQWLRNLFFVAAAGAVGALAFGRREDPRLVLTALDAQEAAALCAREGVPLADFWQRAEVMGLGGVVLREESLKSIAQRGTVLMFSRDEVEKWRAAGLISPAVPIKPGTVWIKEPAVLEAVLQAASRHGVEVTTSTMSGFHLVHFPENMASAMGSLDDIRVGVYDPEIMKSLEGRGLTRVFAQAGVPPGLYGSVVVNWKDGRAEGYSSGSYKGTFGAMLDVAELPVDASLPRLLKAVYSHPARALVLRLSAAGVESDFEALRGLLQELKRRGLPAALPAQAPPPPSLPEPLQLRLIELLLGVFAVFGPLLAARAGLIVLKKTRVFAMAHWPVATPVVQLAAGVASVVAAAALVGLASRSCFDSLGLAVFFLSSSWARLALVGPLCIALLTLYTIDPEHWRKKLSSPASWGGLISLLACVAGVSLLIEPRRIMGAMRLAPWLARLQGVPALPWWWAWRWREILVGWPCLLQAFFLINWRMDCPDCASLDGHKLKDPRSWFLLGLLAPIGVMTAVGRGMAPRDLALAQTGWSALAGLFLGACLVAARLRGLHGTKGPGHHRTIDPDSQP